MSRGSPETDVRPDEPGPLCVLARCHFLVCAIETRWIERLAMPEDVHDQPDQRRPDGPWPVHCGGNRYAGWDLGERLGLAATASAWVLLRLPHGPQQLAVALRTGPCLVVRPVLGAALLPAWMFGVRGRGIRSAFRLASMLESGAAGAGLWLDAVRLWTEHEMRASAALVAGAPVTAR